jgi:hypothetical protein
LTRDPNPAQCQLLEQRTSFKRLEFHVATSCD